MDAVKATQAIDTFTSIEDNLGDRGESEVYTRANFLSQAITKMPPKERGIALERMAEIAGKGLQSALSSKPTVRETAFRKVLSGMADRMLHDNWTKGNLSQPPGAYTAGSEPVELLADELLSVPAGKHRDFVMSQLFNLAGYEHVEQLVRNEIDNRAGGWKSGDSFER